VPPDPTWIEFRRRPPGHRFLRDEALYALTEELISAVADGIPGFFSAADEAFERDLARTCGAGFLLGRQISDGVARAETASTPAGYPAMLPIPATARRLAELTSDGDPADALDRLVVLGHFLDRPRSLNHERLCPPLRGDWESETVDSELLRLVGEISTANLAADEASKIRKQAENETEVTRRKQEAYSMWLILNPVFQAAVRDLRQQWNDAVREQRGFPTHPCINAFRDNGADKRFNRRCRDQFIHVYRVWGIERFLTWELPLPLNPSLNGWDAARLLARGELSPPGGPPSTRGDPPWPFTAEDGVSLFLPWHLIRGRQFDLTAVMDRVRLERAPQHLASWLANDSEGDIALQQKFWLYRCHVLVLGRRYSVQCKRNVGRLNEIVGEVIGRTDEVVRKLRQSLVRDLKKLTAD
jgi:hypothetical protein